MRSGRISVPVRIGRVHPTGRTSSQDACPGALQVHPAEDGNLARVRVPGGALRAGQLRALAEMATRIGDGHLELTSRGNVQLRRLMPGAEVDLAQLLREVDLLPSQSHERVRNIVASVLSGRDGLGWLDVRPLVDDLDNGLCADAAMAGLSGRFLFTIDDGREDVSGLNGDVGLLATGQETVALLLAGTDSGLRTRPGTAVAVALAADLAARRACVATIEGATGLWRTDLLVQSERPSHRPTVGASSQRHGLTAVCAAVPLGRLDAAQAEALCRAADDGSGEVRVTPWRTVLVPDLPPDAAAGCPDALASAGLLVDPASALVNVSSCAGRPGCGRSLSDVRADAVKVHVAGTTATALPVHWTGCERGCGSPTVPHVRVRAVAGGYQVDLGGTMSAQVPHGADGPDVARLTGAVESLRSRADLGAVRVIGDPLTRTSPRSARTGRSEA